MRTKSFLTAGALAMLMAACSNEELVTNNEQLSMDRPLAGEVLLTPVFGNDAESRAIWTGTQHVFSEESDRFGVMLMDEWTKAPETGFGAYDFVDYIHTNYPFKSDDGGYTWKSVAGAPLCEGNYFFTFPFDQTMSSRGMITFSVPAVQTNVTAEGKIDALEAVNQYQKYLGYAFIEAGDEVNEVTPNFNYVFANPKFKIKNSTGSSLKVTKLLIRAHEGNGQPILLPTTVQLAPKSGDFDAEAYLEAAGDRKMELAEMQNALTWVDGGRTGKGVYEYVIDCGENYIVPTGEYIRLSAVIPGGFYPTLDVFAFVEEQNSSLDRGIIRLNETAYPNWDGQSQSGSMQNHMKPGITQLYTATVYPQAIGNLGVEGFTVVNSEDMAYVLDLKAKHGGFEMLKITTWGNNVVMTKEIYDLLANENRKGIKVYVDGTIVIPTDAAADAIDQLSTGWDANTTIINQGNQVLAKKEYYCNIINQGTITEAEDVDATIYGNVTVESGKVEINAIEGDVEVKEGAELVASSIAGTLENEGTAVVVTVDGTANNEGALTINNVDRLNNSGNVVAKTGTLKNVVNEIGGSISVEGDATKVISVQNRGLINVIAGATLKDGEVNSYGTVTNCGEILSVLYNYEGTINNGVAGGENAPYIKNIAYNTGDVNAYEGKIANISNWPTGVLHVWAEDVDVTHGAGSVGTTIFEGVDAQHVGYFVDGVDQCPDELRVYRAYADKKTSELEATGKITKFEEVWTSFDIHFDTKGSACKSYFNKIKVESDEVSFTVGAEAKEGWGGVVYANTTFEVAEDAIMNLEGNSVIGVKAIDGDGEIHVATGSSLWVGVTSFNNYFGATEKKGHQIIEL